MRNTHIAYVLGTHTHHAATFYRAAQSRDSGLGIRRPHRRHCALKKNLNSAAPPLNLYTCNASGFTLRVIFPIHRNAQAAATIKQIPLLNGLPIDSELLLHEGRRCKFGVHTEFLRANTLWLLEEQLPAILWWVPEDLVLEVGSRTR